METAPKSPSYVEVVDNQEFLDMSFRGQIKNAAQRILKDIFYEEVLGELADPTKPDNVSGNEKYDIQAEVESRTGETLNAIFEDKDLLKIMDQNEPPEDATDTGELVNMVAGAVIEEYLTPNNEDTSVVAA